jgi:hypothetical protein
MSKLDVKKIISHLEQKWGPGRICPMCGQSSWKVQDSAFQLIEYHEGAALVLGGPVIPVVPVICGNCGHTVLVNAILAGVIQPSLPEKKEEPK